MGDEQSDSADVLKLIDDPDWCTRTGRSVAGRLAHRTERDGGRVAAAKHADDPVVMDAR
jgi:hypothetical protein